MRGRKDNLVGQKFGRLLVIEDSDKRTNYNIRWKCKCDCGRFVDVLGLHLKAGATQSCGCLLLERVTRHGHCPISGTSPTYRTWSCMIGRCRYPSHKQYKDYGGRGIKVCRRWNVFSNFLADMGTRPVGTTIDRVDNNKGYAPSNCRWATMKQQQNNKRKKRKSYA